MKSVKERHQTHTFLSSADFSRVRSGLRHWDIHSQCCYRCMGGWREGGVRDRNPISAYWVPSAPREREQETRGPAVLNNGPAPHQPGLKRPHSVPRLSWLLPGRLARTCIHSGPTCLSLFRTRWPVCECLCEHMLEHECALCLSGETNQDIKNAVVCIVFLDPGWCAAVLRYFYSHRCRDATEDMGLRLVA